MKIVVDVNPFTMVATISAKVNKVEERTEINWSPYDFGNVWYTFTLGGKVYDILFSYDNALSVVVEDAEDGTEQSVKLEISLKAK
jgi:hypothetical protein